MIRHTIVFRLKSPPNSTAAQSFLAAARCLATIPGVERFECLRQVGTKNTFSFGLSMEFANTEAYRLYNEHPEHARFVQEHWLQEVDEFLEIDYTPIVQEP